LARLELYGSAVCPFAHRSRLALAEKRIPYELIEIDLQNKPAGFSEISPYGKVPVVRDGAHRIWESAIINEYLDEAFPEPALLPRDPARRADARIWINFADARLFALTAKLLYGCERRERPLLIGQIAAELQVIENEALAKRLDDGPYWLGGDISLVDLTFYPWFEQLVVLERFRDFQLPTGLNRLRQWREAVALRPSVQSVARSPDFYLERYGRLAERMSQSMEKEAG
jgi:glutathione S-transferase